MDVSEHVTMIDKLQSQRLNLQLIVLLWDMEHFHIDIVDFHCAESGFHCADIHSLQIDRADFAVCITSHYKLTEWILLCGYSLIIFLSILKYFPLKFIYYPIVLH